MSFYLTLNKKIAVVILFIVVFLVFTPIESESGLLYIFVTYIVSILGLLILSYQYLSKPNLGYALIIKIIAFLFLCTLSLLTVLLPPVIYLIYLALSILGGVLIYIFTKKNPNIIIRSLEFYIFLNVLGLIFQFIYSEITGSFISLHELIFPFSTDRGSYIQSLGLSRINGFHLEPGTYGTWLSFAIVALLILKPKSKFIIYLGIMSLCLTLSTTAIIYALLFVLFILIHNRKKVNIFALSTVVFTIVLVGYYILFYLGIYEYFNMRFGNNDLASDGTAQLKFHAFQYLIQANDIRKIFGSGFMVNDCIYCSSLQDTGVGFNLIFYFGIFSLAVFIFLVSLSRPKTIYHWLALVLILLSKAFIFSPAIWFLMFVIRADSELN